MYIYIYISFKTLPPLRKSLNFLVEEVKNHPSKSNNNLIRKITRNIVFWYLLNSLLISTTTNQLHSIPLCSLNSLRPLLQRLIITVDHYNGPHGQWRDKSWPAALSVTELDRSTCTHMTMLVTILSLLLSVLKFTCSLYFFIKPFLFISRAKCVCSSPIHASQHERAE